MNGWFAAIVLWTVFRLAEAANIEVLQPGESWTVRPAAGFSMGGDETNGVSLFYSLTNTVAGAHLKYSVFDSSNHIIFQRNGISLSASTEYFIRSDFHDIPFRADGVTPMPGFVDSSFRASQIDHITFTNDSSGGQTVSFATPSLYFGLYSAANRVYDWVDPSDPAHTIPINYLFNALDYVPSDVSQSARQTPLSPSTPMLLRLQPGMTLTATNDQAAPSAMDMMTLFYLLPGWGAGSTFSYDVFANGATQPFYQYDSFAAWMTATYPWEQQVRSDFAVGWNVGSLADFMGGYATTEFLLTQGYVDIPLPSLYYAYYDGTNPANGKQLAVDYIPVAMDISVVMDNQAPEPSSLLTLVVALIGLAIARTKAVLGISRRATMGPANVGARIEPTPEMARCLPTCCGRTIFPCTLGI